MLNISYQIDGVNESYVALKTKDYFMNDIQLKEVNLNFDPKILTLVVSYKCTASCSNCCFSCNPSRSEDLELTDGIKIIKEAVLSFPKLSLLVITGGEPFMRGQEYLITLIQTAKKHNLHIRVVTNAYWATTRKKAHVKLKKLIDAGLNEINFSTGDDHLKFVPIHNVINATIESSRLQMQSVINIEGHSNSQFTPDKFRNIKQFKEYFKNKNEFIPKIINGIWVPLNNPGNIEYDEKGLKRAQEFKKGCESIINTISVFPDKTLKSCCGLTVNKIKEFKLGYLDGTNMKDLYVQQFQNMINIWLLLDGPYKVFNSLSKFNPILNSYKRSHACQVCSLLFNNKTVRQTLINNYQKLIPEIVFKYQIHKQLNNF